MPVPEYRPIVNAVALDRLSRPVHIPDGRLMVGSFECLEPLPMLIYKDLGPSAAPAVMKTYDQLTIEEAAEKIASEGLTVDDFPGNTMYLGEPVAGF